MRVGPFEILIFIFLIALPLSVWRFLSSHSKKPQNQAFIVQQSPAIQQPVRSGNVIHNVTYNIHDSAISGDITTVVNEQDD